MKRKLSLLLCAALTLSLLAGCGPKNTGNGSASGSDSTSQSTSQNTGDRTQVDFMVLSGPTGVGAAKLLSDNDAGTTLNDYNAEVVTENGQIQTALTSGEVDIAAIATNVAANLAAQSDGSIQMLAVNTLGVLYILDKNVGVTSLADLSGKTIYTTGKGANPEYILNYLLTQNGVDPATDVTIEWLTAEEVSAKMISSDSAVCMLRSRCHRSDGQGLCGQAGHLPVRRMGRAGQRFPGHGLRGGPHRVYRGESPGCGRLPHRV